MRRPIRFIITLFVLHIIISGFTPEAFALSSGRFLENEILKKIEGQSISSEENGYALDSLKARSTVTSLELIQGTAPKPNLPVYGFLLTDEKRVFDLGSARTNAKGEFALVIADPLPDIQGEVILVLSPIPDLTLTTLSTLNWMALPLIIDQESSVPDELTPTVPGLFLNPILFQENGQKLRNREADILTVYREKEGIPLDLLISGQVFSKNLSTPATLELFIIPSLEQRSIPITVEADGQFKTAISYRDLPFSIPIQIIVQVKTTMPEESQSSPLVQQFILKPATEIPRIDSTLTALLSKHAIPLTLILLILILSIMIVKELSQKNSSHRRIGSFVIVLELGFLMYSVTTVVMNELIHSKLILQQEETVFTVGRKFPEAEEILSLTKLNENLEVIPSLALSWSQISNTGWEFSIRQDEKTAEDIVSRLTALMASESEEKQYLSTVHQFSSADGNRVLLTTKAADPLIPQKLSRINLNGSFREKDSGTRQFVTLESFPNQKLRKRSDTAYELPFISDIPFYEKNIYEKNQDVVKKMIATRSIDLFDAPEIALWPALSKNGYRILPKMNTEIVVLMTNRSSYFLKNSELISALRKILLSTRILQTSYFQYGRLGSQFAPPGVLGYSSTLKIPDDPREVSQILGGIQETLEVDALTLKLHYPAQERKLALVMERELEREGLNIIPVEISKKKFKEALLQKLPDLILVPLEFELGDVGPFLDTFIDSKSPFNTSYTNAEVDALIEKARTELNSFKRLKILHQIMRIITIDDPAGIPILFKKSFVAVKSN